MAPHGISSPPGAVVRGVPIPHDCWLPDRLTGMVALRLETPSGQYVSPGTGRLGLAEREEVEVVTLQAARRRQMPVVPGSGIKGAVRTVYEILSSSCDPLLQGQDDRCRPGACCEACSLFGLLGWGGRVTFSDASPAGEVGVVAELAEVPIPWKPDGSKTPGDYRLYDLQRKQPPKARKGEPGEPLKRMTREVYRGVFETRMTFWNLSEEELARLFLAMGLGADPATRFFLRLGGVKYDGKGAVAVTPVRLELRQPPLHLTTSEACQAHFEPWIRSARKSNWGTAFWGTLQQTAKILGPRP